MRDAPTQPSPASGGGKSLQVGARGTLVTFTVIRKAPAAFAAEPLYAVAIVELDVGGGRRRVIGRIEPFEPAPRLGATVTLARFAEETPVFAPLPD